MDKMRKYKSVVMVVPYIGHIENMHTFLKPLNSDELKFIGQDLCANLEIQEVHDNYTDCIKQLKNTLQTLLKENLTEEDLNASEEDQSESN